MPFLPYSSINLLLSLIAISILFLNSRYETIDEILQVLHFSQTPPLN